MRIKSKRSSHSNIVRHYITEPMAAGQSTAGKEERLNWKFVMNGNNFKNHIDAAVAARKAGYKFFLYNGTIYFRDEISCHVFDTGLSEKDLTG